MIAVMDGLQIQWLYDPGVRRHGRGHLPGDQRAGPTRRTVGAPARRAAPSGLSRHLTPGRTRPMDPITGSVQHYAWGSTTAHARSSWASSPTAGRRPSSGWGRIRSAPSRVGDRRWPTGIDADSARRRGRGGRQRVRAAAAVPAEGAGRRPAAVAAGPPDASQAEAGFAREEAAGIDRAAPTRLYRDDWPKPEMLVALGDVEALCGFREPDETYALFARLGVPAATELVAPLQGGGPDQLAEVFARRAAAEPRPSGRWSPRWSRRRRS